MMVAEDYEQEVSIFLSPERQRSIEKKVVTFLISCGIKEFPIDPFDMASLKSIRVLKYSSLDDEKRIACIKGGIEAYTDYKGKSCSIYYDESRSNGNIRFNIMHELGHIELGHKEDSDLADKIADHFAGYAIAPPPVIDKLGCETVYDIMSAFDVSEKCAEVRLDYFKRWKREPIKDFEKDLLRHLGYEI